MMKVWFVISALLASGLCQPQVDGTQYVGCQTSSQCGPGKCCVLLRGRYATTACAAYRQLGEDCRPSSDTPLNTSLSFPGGATVAVTGVHESLCPCTTGATCYRGTCLEGPPVTGGQ